jgi:hypothetical protein
VIAGFPIVSDYPDCAHLIRVETAQENVIPREKTYCSPDGSCRPIVSVPLKETTDASCIHIAHNDDGARKTFSIFQHGFHLIFPLPGSYLKCGPEMEAVDPKLPPSHFQGGRHGNTRYLFRPARVGQKDLFICHDPPRR